MKISNRNEQLITNLDALNNSVVSMNTTKRQIALEKLRLDMYCDRQYIKMYEAPNKLSEHAIMAKINSGTTYEGAKERIIELEHTLRELEAAYEHHKRAHQVLMELPVNYVSPKK